MKKSAMLLIPLFLVAVSCTSTKKVSYFQGVDDRTYEEVAGQYEIKIAPNDNLHITVNALSSDPDRVFDNLNTSTRSNVSAETLAIMGYLVDNEGNINFPMIGTVHLAGKTRQEAVDYLRVELSKYLNNPIVNIRFLNYKVTVLGEVNRPGTYTIRDERVSLPEALGMAGDMTIYGKRDNVLVARDENGVKTFHRLDMTSADVFMSSYYYLRQNDVVYVQPNRARAGSSSYNQNLTLGVSVVSLLVTVISLVTR